MRVTTGAALLAFLLLGTAPARAQPPVAVSAYFGWGAGSWDREGLLEPEGAIVAMLGTEVAWRFAPGYALVGALDFATGPMFTMSWDGSNDGSVLQDFAVTFGPEVSFPPKSPVALFCRVSGGAGKATYYSVEETGFAWSGAAGLRSTRRLGPIGFTLALRAQGTSANRSSFSGAGIAAGIELGQPERP